MQTNLFSLAQQFLAQQRSRNLAKPELDEFWRDCVRRRNKAMLDLREASVYPPRPHPEYRNAKLARARAQQELAVVVPVLRQIRGLRQAMARKQQASPYQMALKLLAKATRSARSQLLQPPVVGQRFLFDAPYYEAQCITEPQVELARALLLSHPAIFGEVPQGLLLEVPLERAQSQRTYTELVLRKRALVDKVIAAKVLDPLEVELLRRFMGISDGYVSAGRGTDKPDA